MEYDSKNCESLGCTPETFIILLISYQFNSVQFSCTVVSDSLWPHELQHAKPPCLSPTPRAHPNTCPLSWWCHPAISSSVIPFSSCPQFFPASESFPMSQLVAWGGQSIGVSALASFLPKNTQDWSPLEWAIWISIPQFKKTKLKKKTCCDFPGALVLKNLPANAGDPGSIPGLGRLHMPQGD